jgi:chemotaxis protein MotB
MSTFHRDEPATSPHTRPVPPPPAASPEPPVIEWEDPPLRESRSTTAWIVAVLMGASALGLGYLAWQLRAADQTDLAKLASATTQVRTLTQERSLNTKAIDGLQQQSAAHKQRIEQADAELSELKAKLGASESRLGEIEAQSEELKEHVAEFRSVTRQFQRMIDSGRLQINFRRGRMIVELPAAVLFASGSADLSTDGRSALQEVAKILRKVPGKRFMVGGHTDDVPIVKANGGYPSNWALSAARAVTVTEALVAAGLRPNHLVAAGYGEYDPIAGNTNERGRQKNRRIEIVLEPALSGLPDALAGLSDKSAAAKAKAPLAKK